MRTEDLRAFFQIAKTGSLTAASAALGVPKSTVSRRLTRLEEELDAQLVLRTSRSVHLTELGQTLHRQGAPALAYLDEVQRAVRERGETPAGPLRVSAPPDLAAAHLGAMFAEFVIEYPEVDLTLVSTGEFVDLISQGIDLALRIHIRPLSSVTSLRARRLAAVERGLYASPSYLEQKGRPRRPEDLRRHSCLSMAAQPYRWELTRRPGRGGGGGGRAVSIEVNPRLRSNDHHALKDAAERGAGVAVVPAFLGDVGVNRGTLVRVLPGWSMGASTLSAVWPATLHTSPRIRAFVDAAAAYFAPPPWSGP
jgi:DNA-binding transcriptional LysR family regulator